MAVSKVWDMFVPAYWCSIIFGFLLSSPKTELQCLRALQHTITEY